MLGILLSTSTLAATVRLSAPLALATMGSVFGHKAKIFNIGLESYVLTSAFFATWGSYLFENAFMGLLFGMASGVVMSAIFGTFVLHFKSDPIVVGIAMNLSAWGSPRCSSSTSSTSAARSWTRASRASAASTSRCWAGSPLWASCSTITTSSSTRPSPS